MTRKRATKMSPEDAAVLRRRIAQMMDPEEWDADDFPPTWGSLRTLVRAHLATGQFVPTLGIDNEGHFVASWAQSRNHYVSATCFENGNVRWSWARPCSEGTGYLHEESHAGEPPDFVAVGIYYVRALDKTASITMGGF